MPTFSFLHKTPMYVDKCVVRTKNQSYTRYLLRESKREGKRTLKTTLLNITPWGETTCEALRFALANKDRLNEIGFDPVDFRKIADSVSLEQNLPIGAVWLLYQRAMRNGLVSAFGDEREGRLALWQVLARTLDQGSRLSAVRLARDIETGFLRLGTFSEDDLYKNLDWIAKNQHRIEKALYHKRHDTKPCRLFLYDVTSSYLEGTQNALANYGYNRDKKRGKMQIIIGLLCDDDGRPIAVKVFEGNTSDVKTFSSQVRKVADRFNVDQVVFVGDRGMIKSVQQKELSEEGFDFITALTKPQIETLIKQGDVQLELFDENINEVILDNDKRYVLRRNPVRAEEIAAARASKLQSLQDFAAKKNEYLHKHGKAKLEIALKQVRDRAKRLNIDKWIECESDLAFRTIGVRVNDLAFKETSRLDGCYCLTTSLSAEEMDKETVHARYKDLAKVEEAFRTCKTGHLEVRPVYVRKADRTRAHVFVVMLAYLLVQELQACWREVDATVEENLLALGGLCGVRMTVSSEAEIDLIPKPNTTLQKLFALAAIEPPVLLPAGKTSADTKKKLKSRRK